MTQEKKKVLLVEDDEITARILKRVLDKLGYEVVHFTSAHKGYHHFLADPQGYEIILSDNNTEGPIAGVEFLMFVHRDRATRGQRFYLMSGDSHHNGQPLKPWVEHHGATFLEKPRDLSSSVLRQKGF